MRAGLREGELELENGGGELGLKFEKIDPSDERKIR